MRIVLGVLEADAGVVTWRGADSRTLPRATWGYLPEERGLYPRMLVIDQLVYFAALYGVAPDRARRGGPPLAGALPRPDLAFRRADELSKGNQQKIQLIAAILHDPEVLLMDEPFTGLDPVNVAILGRRSSSCATRANADLLDPPDGDRRGALRVDRDRRPGPGRCRRAAREIRRAAGRRLVHLSVEGDHRLPWIAAVPERGSCEPASVGPRSSSTRASIPT